MAVASLRLVQLIHGNVNLSHVSAIGSTIGLLWLIAVNIEKSVAIDTVNRTLRDSTRVLNFVIGASVKYLAKYSWARVRLDGNAHDQLFVELGTSGYETIEIFVHPYDNGGGLSEAKRICNEVAEGLALQNKGYKEMA